MILPDVNVLIYAFRRDVPQHAACIGWLNSVIDGEANFGLSLLTLAAVIRVSTDRRIYREPSTIDDTVRFCDYLLEQAHCQIVEPGERHWDIFKKLCVEAGIVGPRVTDAWYAALAIEWGCEWITTDRDFARFPNLKWSTPTD